VLFQRVDLFEQSIRLAPCIHGWHQIWSLARRESGPLQLTTYALFTRIQTIS
jgi:hypothetical protein